MQFFSSAISFFNFYYCLSLLFYFYIHIIIGYEFKLRLKYVHNVYNKERYK